jgi:ESS family glutamate:Na+ symporter
MNIVMSFVGLCLLLVVGHLLRIKVRLLRRLYLPCSVIGGLIGLTLMQATRAAGAPLSPDWTAGWSRLPGFLINIVFACLFLGVRIPKVSTLWRRAGPQLAYGQTVAWGQYIVGVGLVMGFEGGHGTAAGMGPVFAGYGWPAGKDLGLASATAGIVSAVVFGMVLINWAARRGLTVRRQDPEDVPEGENFGVIPLDHRPEAGRLTVSSSAIEAFSLHVAVVGMAIFIGFGLYHGLVGIGRLTGSPTVQKIMGAFPLFPLCMIGGIIVQLIEDRFDRARLIDTGLVRRIQNTALDFLIVAAIATINLSAVVSDLAPFAVVVAAAIAWNVFCLLVLAKRMLPDAWFERAIAEMGQSMGITATGLMLLRVVDPDYETPAADAFASKQLMHEPFMGGGLWTATAVPLLATVGSLPVFLIACGAVAFWMAVTFLPRLFERGRTEG